MKSTPTQQKQAGKKAPQLPHSHAQRWILAHDIREPKRLNRLRRYLQKEGLHLQYSVYLLKGSRAQIEKVVQTVLSIINEQADDVRIYAVTENTRFWGLGTQFEDQGNMLCDAVLDTLIENRGSQPLNTENHHRHPQLCPLGIFGEPPRKPLSA